jgi:hypothetical protein
MKRGAPIEPLRYRRLLGLNQATMKGPWYAG